MRRPLALLCLVAAACGSSGENDKPKDLGPPSPLGTGRRIAEVTDPAREGHPAHGASISVSAVVVTAVDNFDETGRGARGTIYVQDLSSQAPFAAISLFSPTFVPADLRIAPGDVLDLEGEYQENGAVGSAKFDPGEVLVQLSRPVGRFRYEYKPPEPAVIDANDLTTFAAGRKWMGMLVTVKNVTLAGDLYTDTANRIGSSCPPQGTSGPCSGAFAGDPESRKSPTISNELYGLKQGDFRAGQKFKSITGLVTYFFKFHLAPRSPADLVPE
jgi:hypothetical protein